MRKGRNGRRRVDKVFSTLQLVYFVIDRCGFSRVDKKVVFIEKKTRNNKENIEPLLPFYLRSNLLKVLQMKGRKASSTLPFIILPAAKLLHPLSKKGKLIQTLYGEACE